VRHTALILAAHGAGDGSDVNRIVRGYAKQVASLGRFDEVLTAFHLGGPNFAEVLGQTEADGIVVVPIMTSEGFFCQTVLPAELKKHPRASEVRIRQTRPVGTHPGIADMILERVRWLIDRFGLTGADTALLLVGHGTKHHRDSRNTTIELAEGLSKRNVLGSVEAAFLDDDPRIEDVTRRVDCSNQIVIPFFLGGGQHVVDDIPRRLGLTSGLGPIAGHVHGRFIVCDRAIGTDPRLIEIIADLADTASPSALSPVCNRHHTTDRRHTAKLRLGTRCSALALWQARHVAQRLRGQGVNVELAPMTTSGDRDLSKPIAELSAASPTAASPFADDLEKALRAGEIDLAVHSLKDLPIGGGQCPPYTLPTVMANDLVIAAILPRSPASESLVSRHHCPLMALPVGAVIGTSSPRRAAQVRALRPDLRVEPIRGPVDDRVQQVRAGLFDAAILATAGLLRLGLENEIAQRFELDEFLPAPGQAALAVQVRRDDLSTRAKIASLDHEPTRRATGAELDFLQPFESRDDVAVAAYAHYPRTGGTVWRSQAVNPRNTWPGVPDHATLTLHARILSIEGKILFDGVLSGDDPQWHPTPVEVAT